MPNTIDTVEADSRVSSVLEGGASELLKARQLKSRFPAARFPRLQVAGDNEVLVADLHHRNAIFLDDSAELPRRVACLTCRGGNIQKILLRLVNCVCAHENNPSLGIG